MTRGRLPERRPLETFQLDHTWLRGTDRQVTETMTVTVGRYGIEDLRIGEVFVNCDNHLNERAIALWHDIGILISFALQHGATIPELCSAMSRGDVPVMDKVLTVAHSPAGTLLEFLADLEAQYQVEGGS